MDGEPHGGVSPDLVARMAKPQATEVQDAWEILIAGYLYLGGLGAGAFAVAVVAGWVGLSLTPAFMSPLGDWAWDWSKVLVLWGPFATAIGASLLVLHLGRNRIRAYSACFNPRTSWMARGFIILATFIALGVAAAAISVFEPSWPSAVKPLWRTLEVLGVLSAFGTAIYTGILLQSMSFIPAWNSPVLPYLFLASALSTGAMGVLLGALVYRFMGGDHVSAHELVLALEHVEPGLIVIEAALLGLYLRRLRAGKPEGLSSSEMWLRGRWRMGFWGGIVGLALSVPLILDVASHGLHSEMLAILAAVSVLMGGFLLRCGVLAIGIREVPPLCKLARWRTAHPAIAPGSRELSGAGR